MPIVFTSVDETPIQVTMIDSGPEGPIGPQGEIGPQGPIGNTGQQGETGLAGKTVLSGTGVPASGLGTDGDFYIDTVASDLYGPKAAGTWGAAVSLIGPQGIQGIQGIQGLQGIQGDTGDTGPQGIQGDQGPQGIQGNPGLNGDGSGDMLAANNLSDVVSPAAALTNLGAAAAAHTHTGTYEPANANIQAHVGSTANPHSVTAAQLGLGNVDNTADADKPVSTATQTALNGKLATGGQAADSALLDGQASSAFATASHNHDGSYAATGHNHDGAYLGIGAKAADAELLDGVDSANYARTDIAETFDQGLTVTGLIKASNVTRRNAAVQATGFTALINESYWCNTSGGAFTMTLPLTPTVGQRVGFADYAGTFDTLNLTIAGNGEKIMGLAEDLVCDLANFSGELEYIDAAQGWRLI